MELGRWRGARAVAGRAGVSGPWDAGALGLAGLGRARGLPGRAGKSEKELGWVGPASGFGLDSGFGFSLSFSISISKTTKV